MACPLPPLLCPGQPLWASLRLGYQNSSPTEPIASLSSDRYNQSSFFSSPGRVWAMPGWGQLSPYSTKSDGADTTFAGCRCPVTAQSGRCITCTLPLPNLAKSATYRKSRCSSAVPARAPSTRGSAPAVTSARARWPCARAACEAEPPWLAPAQHLPTCGWQAPALS